MAKNKEEKTNVMRTLDQRKVPYTPHTYDPNGPVDGVSVAAGLGMDPASVFKTLVAKGASGAYYVFDIPVAESLDLKKAARAVGEKSVAMIHQKELLPLPERPVSTTSLSRGMETSMFLRLFSRAPLMKI